MIAAESKIEKFQTVSRYEKSQFFKGE